jgi:hypothetical protein
MNDRQVIESFEKSWGQRTAIIAFIVVVAVVLFGVLAHGFYGRHIRRDAAALQPVDVPTKPYTRPSL